MGYGRILGPELFGSLATSQNQVILWSMLVDLGLSHSLIGALTSAEGGRTDFSRQGFRARDLVFRVLILRLCGASAGALGVYLLARAHDPAMFWQSIAYLPYLFALGVQQTAVGFALYRGRQGMAVLAQIAGFFVSVALTLWLATRGTALGWLLLSQSWGGLLGGGLILGIFYLDSLKRKREGNTRRLDRTHGGPWGKEAWGALLKEAWPYAITYAVFVVWQRLDQLAVSHFLGHAQGGQYAMAVRLVAIPLLVATSISLALFPDLQRIGRDAPERVRVLLGFASKIIWRYGIVAAALMLVAIALLVMPLQPQFKPAFKLLPYFVPGVWAFWMQSFLMNALFGLRRYRLVVELHLLSLVVYVLAIYFLTPRFGVHGVVWAFNLFCLSMSFLGFRAARKAGLLEKDYSLFGAFSAEESALWRQAAARAKTL
jgi:O-antigen/teichoic acid export membrane protein